MISIFDLEKLQELLKDFYILTKIRIMVYDADFVELCSYPEKRTPICQLIRSNLHADEACMRCDREACLAASSQTEPHIYTCHAGLTEAVSTLRVNSAIVGYLSFGHIFSFDSHEAGLEQIWSHIAQYGLEKDALKKACTECPVISKEYVLSAAHILDAVASFLVLQRMAVLKKDSMEMQLDRYLSECFTQSISVSDICKHFGIGKTTLYKLARKSYGCGLAEHIRRLRIEKAKSLLLDHPEMSVAEIAASCGYSDYNYFIAVFSRMEKMPPRQFQKQAKIP